MDRLSGQKSLLNTSQRLLSLLFSPACHPSHCKCLHTLHFSFLPLFKNIFMENLLYLGSRLVSVWWYWQNRLGQDLFHLSLLSFSHVPWVVEQVMGGVYFSGVELGSRTRFWNSPGPGDLWQGARWLSALFSSTVQGGW